MTAPVVTETYPANNDTGIPVGITLAVLFDRGIDLSTAKNSVVIYGADFDRTSGPDQNIWTDGNTLTNPFYLQSPGFQGLVPANYRVVYWDLTNDVEIDPGVITSEADEVTANVGHKLYITPTKQMAADTQYRVFIMGDPDSTNNGIAGRTVFDIEPGVGNVGTDGSVSVYGGYTGVSADTVVIEITTGGDIGDAKYRWYYVSAGVGAAVTGRITARRNRLLDNGLQVRFNGSDFQVGDTYTFNVEPIQRLATNTQITFTTSDGSFSEAPDSPSTPASSLPPASVLPSLANTSAGSLYVTDMTPSDRSYNVSKNLREITILFSEDIDPSTITDDTVTLTKIHAAGEYSETNPPQVLAKSLTVSGNELTINF